MTTRKAILLPDDLDTQLAEVGGMWGVGNERHIEQFVGDVREALGAEVIELIEERVTSSIATADQRQRDSATRTRWVSEWEVDPE